MRRADKRIVESWCSRSDLELKVLRGIRVCTKGYSCSRCPYDAETGNCNYELMTDAASVIDSLRDNCITAAEVMFGGDENDRL